MSLQHLENEENPRNDYEKMRLGFFFLTAFSTFSFTGHERGNPRRERPVSHSSSMQLHCQGNNFWMCAFQTELHIGPTDTI